MIFHLTHDAPAINPDPMRVLSGTVARWRRSGNVPVPHQRVSVQDALNAMTMWPAYQH